MESNKQDIAANKLQIAANRERISENEQDIQDVLKRFDDLTEFDVKGQATVLIASSSKTISESDQTSLRELARNAASLKDT